MWECTLLGAGMEGGFEENEESTEFTITVKTFGYLAQLITYLAQ